MMNGDYAVHPLLEALADQPRERQEPADGLGAGAGRHAGRRAERPGKRSNPLIDNGFMYTTDGWGTLYKIDARNPNRGQFVWVDRSRREARGQRAAHARHRALGRPGDRQPSRRPRDRHQSRQRRNRLGQDGRRHQRVRQPGKILHGADHRRRQGLIANGAGDAGTRGWVAALDARTGNELWRWYVVPKPGDPGSETWKDKNNAWKTGGGGIWQTGSYDPATKLTIWGTGNPVPDLRPAVPSRRQPLHQLGRRAQRRHRQAGLAFPVHAERLVGLRRGRRPHAVRHDDRRPSRKVVGHFGRNGFFYSLDRTNGKFIKGDAVRQRSELDQGHRSRRPASRSNTIRSSTCRSTTRRRARCAATPTKRTCPTWHGGVAHQPTRVQPGQAHRLRRRHRRLLLAERRRGRRSSRRTAASTRRTARSARTAATSTTAR